MNVLHEIGTKLWVSLFRQIKDCLRSDGVLIFAEAKVLSIGEQPYCENGYIVLGEKQIRILFKKNEYDSQIAAFHADFGKKEKSEFVERFPELSLFFKAYSLLDSEMICIFPYFCPYAESAREIREIFS
ncbi:hypothetical protein DW049_20245 [Ruminococcus sp. AF41-9]|nr:hypothetical protein DW049_20245 [Ruminococcus sp. AF41-9]